MFAIFFIVLAMLIVLSIFAAIVDPPPTTRREVYPPRGRYTESKCKVRTVRRPGVISWRNGVSITGTVSLVEPFKTHATPSIT